MDNKTLDFQLDIQSDNEGLLYDATLEARRVYNETIRLAKEGVDWDAISPRLEDHADLMKNTTQRIAAKALDAMDNYYEYDDFGKPTHTKSGPYPLRANFTEGYTLSSPATATWRSVSARSPTITLSASSKEVTPTLTS
ncbi:MAG: hypothetical protein J07HQW1_03397 [Haloquadratum walsbyi J07HQW1]|uniref:Uncharacterized protein n=1 Tax=Haloquadratum walsbyi J07HQW1 TaxID=1238424 RepID=U1PM83_9EURY|nr:MAG: hypothetical protein J07HQW1_03397 [Haloquadratum walsbyi J07HQW1]